MTASQILFTIAHWLHLTAAITAVGGTITLRMVVHPAVIQLTGEARETFERTVRRKLTMLVTHSVALLFITGLVNVARVWRGEPTALYMMLLLVKVLLAMVVFVLALALVIPSEALDKLQSRRPFWMTVNAILGLIVVLISATIRLLPPA